MGTGSELFELESLQKALAANLLIANNDMHLGNMILYGNENCLPLRIQAFDFGAAFNMERDARYRSCCAGGLSRNHNVCYTQHFRGAITTEGLNRFHNYPKEWTEKSI